MTEILTNMTSWSVNKSIKPKVKFLTKLSSEDENLQKETVSWILMHFSGYTLLMTMKRKNK